MPISTPMTIADFHPSGARAIGQAWRGPVWSRPHFVRHCQGCVSSLLSRAKRIAEGKEKPDADVGITPDSPLAQLLGKLKRPERRLLLAVVQAKPGPRRVRMDRELHRRFRLLGVETV